MTNEQMTLSLTVNQITGYETTLLKQRYILYSPLQSSMSGSQDQQIYMSSSSAEQATFATSNSGYTSITIPYLPKIIGVPTSQDVTYTSMGSSAISVVVSNTEYFATHTIVQPFFSSPKLTEADPLEAERNSFLSRKSELLQDSRYRDKYVAFLRGELIDCDRDLRILAKRVYKKFGYVPIYMDQVTEKKRKFESSSPEPTAA